VAVSLGCVATPPSVPDEQDQVDPVSDAIAPGALVTCTPTSVAQFAPEWSCSQSVNFYAAAGNLRDALDGATNEWLVKADVEGLPQFFTTVDSATASAHVSGPATGNELCGLWLSAPNQLLTYSGTGCAGFTNKGAIGDLLRHELGHAFGWTGTGVHKSLAVAGVSDHCAIHLPENGSFNPGVCAHEIEGAAKAYGLRTLPADYWSKEFAVGPVSVLSPVTIEATATHQYNPNGWRLDRGGSFAGEYSWSSSNTAAATVSSSGLVTGVAPGTATIRALPTGSSTVLKTTKFTQTGTSATVTVVAQQPAALVIQDITIDSLHALPVTEPDSITWTAKLAPGDATGVTYRWVIEYSDTSPPDSLFIPARTSSDTAPYWGSPPFLASKTWRGYAREGSYTIRIKVWPARAGVVGTPAEREFPVCTSTGNALRADPGAGNDAVGGC